MAWDSFLFSSVNYYIIGVSASLFVLYCAIQCIQLCMLNCIIRSCRSTVYCICASIYSILCCRWGRAYEKVNPVEDGGGRA
jgi:hypothetical protein